VQKKGEEWLLTQRRRLGQLGMARGGSDWPDDEKPRRRRTPTCVGERLSVDRAEGSRKGETTAGSRCIMLRRSSPWPRRWQKPSDDGETAGQRWWQRCELGECEGRERENEGQGRDGVRGLHLALERGGRVMGDWVRFDRARGKRGHAAVAGEGMGLTSGTRGPVRAGARECATMLTGRTHWSEREGGERMRTCCKENGPRAIWLNRFWCLLINITYRLMCLLVFMFVVHGMLK
jgi:hypothetical protein